MASKQSLEVFKILQGGWRCKENFVLWRNEYAKQNVFIFLPKSCQTYVLFMIYFKFFKTSIGYI